MIALKKIIDLGEEPASFKVISRHYHEQNYKEYGIKSIRGIEYDNKEKSAGKWFYGFNVNDPKDKLYRLYKEIENSDVLILGAGNFLVDYTIDLVKGPIPMFFILSCMAKTANTKIFWFGISVGPIKTLLGEKMSYISALLADKITVRDKHSKVILKKMGVKKSITVLPDPVLGLKVTSPTNMPKEYKMAHAISKRVVCISLRALPPNKIISDEDFINKIRVCCDFLVEKLNCVLLFIPHCTYENGDFNSDDRNINTIVASQMLDPTKVFLIKETLTISQQINLYKNAFGSVCMRLHASVFSIMQGVPSIGLNYNKKVHQFYEWCKLTDFVVEIGNVNSENILKKFSLALAQKEKFEKMAKKINIKGDKIIEKYANIATKL